MKKRPTEPITEGAGGEQTHPAFAVVGISRSKGTPRALFQSDLMHSSTIVLSIQTATRIRDLNRDWVHPDKTLLEIEMSETQWGGIVSSMGLGSGVPVTLRTRESDPFVPDLPYQPRTEENRREVAEKVDELLAQVREAVEALDAAEENKAGIKERREIRRNLKSLLQNAGRNAQYAVDSLSEAAENTVNQARADIETHLMTTAAAHGIPITVAFPDLAQLPGLSTAALEAPVEK